MASPPQDQSTGSPNMLDLDHLVWMVQDVRQKVHQLQEELHERKKNEALQGSSQQNELDPTKSKVQKLQTHIQQLEDIMKEMAKKRIQLLNECTDCLDQCQSRWISRLKEWKWQQQKAVIRDPFDKDLDPLQSWCEKLFEVNNNLREELQLVGEPMSELQDRLVKLLEVLVQSSLVVDEQPPQVIQILSKFSTTVRCLLVEKVMPVMFKVKIINELQARDLDSRLSDDAGELRNNTANLEPDRKSRYVTFWNMCIKNIERPHSWGLKPETEQKFSLLFSTEIFIPSCDTRYWIQTISLPVVVIRSSIQGSSARATIIWDCAFSEADRVPFMVPEQVPWSTMFNTLNSKFTAEAQTQHNLDQHNQQGLAQKILNKPDCGDDFSNMMVSWAQFNKRTLPGQQFTFWEWFEGLMKLTKTHLKTYWSEGLIFGVIGKQKLRQILRNSPTGTFLLHFSNSKIGGITITYVSATEEGKPKIQSISPFTQRDLYIRSLGNRIQDISHITHLYPDIPKHEAFKRVYSGPHMLQGYIPLSRIGRFSQPVTGSKVDISDTKCLEGNSRDDQSKIQEKYKEASSTVASPFDSHVDLLDQPPPVKLTETEMTINQSAAADASKGFSQDNIREMDLHETAGPSTLQLSTSGDDDSDSAAFYDKTKERDEMRLDSPASPVTDDNSHLPSRKDTDDGDPSFDNSSPTLSRPSCSQSTAQTVCSPPCPQDSPVVLQDSTVCTEGSRAQDAFELLSFQSECESGGDSDAPVNMESAATAVKSSVTNTQSTHCLLQLSSSDPGWSERDSSCLSRSHSVPSLSQTTSPENKTFTRSQSLPDMLIKSSFKEFTPDITDDEDDETYRFQCSCPGLYQCSVTGLVFHMEGEGDVVYRTVPWDRRLLAQHHKQPAGPLFDIKCLQQSVCQLHLPHCEIRSTGGCEFLSVAHVNDEGIEFIVPQKITETHVIINITGFSGFGNVKDEDSPPDPVRALVLLFYRPPADPNLRSILNVLLLPKNVVLRDVLRTRKKLVGDEIYIETSPHCKLCPKQEYTLSTCPEDDSVLVKPNKAEFDCDNYDNYFPSFQVKLKTIRLNINLVLRDTNSSSTVWDDEVDLLSTAVRRPWRQGSSSERLLDIRSSFIDGISGPVLKSLLDKLLQKTVLTDSEKESADEIQNHRDKARFVIDTVRKKGEAASSEMIEFLCEVDPFLCEHLGLI